MNVTLGQWNQLEEEARETTQSELKVAYAVSSVVGWRDSSTEL